MKYNSLAESMLGIGEVLCTTLGGVKEAETEQGGKESGSVVGESPTQSGR